MNQFSYAKLNGTITNETKFNIEPLIDEWIGTFSSIYNNGSIFYFQTNYKAPQNKVIMIDLKKPNKTDWVDILPENEKNVL